MKIRPATLPFLDDTLTIMAQIFLSQDYVKKKISKPTLAGNKNASLAQIHSVLNTRLKLKGGVFPVHANEAHRH
jgi:hypothetical protein